MEDDKLNIINEEKVEDYDLNEEEESENIQKSEIKKDTVISNINTKEISHSVISIPEPQYITDFIETKGLFKTPLSKEKIKTKVIK